MANNLTFSFNENPINAILIDDEPWFIAKEVCNALNIQNSRKALTALEQDEKDVTLSDTLGGKQRVAIVSESGLYTLILRCRDAVNRGTRPYQFRRWVTKEVLPTIRKTGSYTHTINTEQQYQIRQAVNNYAYHTGQHHQTIYTKLYNEFKIPRYQDLPAAKFEEAMLFLNANHQPKNILQVDIDLTALPRDNNEVIKALVEFNVFSGRREITLLNRYTQVVDPGNKDQVTNLLQTIDCNLYPMALDVVIGYFKGIEELYHGRVCRSFSN